MAVKSLEFPELDFVPPRAFGSGRGGRVVKLSVVHYTAGSERSTSAEDGAYYDQRRTDQVSTHFFHDQNSSVQCVYRRDRANAAFFKGNRLGVQHELCGTSQTRKQWLDLASHNTLLRAARYQASDCHAFGLLPRRLTVEEVRRCWDIPYEQQGGLCGHDDITHAFPEDGGTHEDPGPEFPWDIYESMVQYYYYGVTMSEWYSGEPRTNYTSGQITQGQLEDGGAPGNLYQARVGKLDRDLVLAVTAEATLRTEKMVEAINDRPIGRVVLSQEDRDFIVAEVSAAVIGEMTALVQRLRFGVVS